MTSELSAAVAAFTARGGHPVRDILALGPSPFSEWDHYPDGDAEDPATGFSWYYHSHVLEHPTLAGSHGHFHLFAASRLFGEIDPIDAPAWPGESDRDGICHLVSLSMTTRGRPQAVMAVNRLEDGQWIYPADATLAMIRRFVLGEATPCADVSRWLGAYIRTQLPVIGPLLDDRDHALDASRRQRDGDGRCAPVFVSRAAAATQPV